VRLRASTREGRQGERAKGAEFEGVGVGGARSYCLAVSEWQAKAVAGCWLQG